MYITLSTAGQQAIMDAATGGYKLTLGKAQLYRTPRLTSVLPYPLTLAEVDSNILASWNKLADNLTAIDDYNAVSPEVFQVVVNVPIEYGPFDFDAVALYLDNGTLLGVGCYKKLVSKYTSTTSTEGNILELDIFIRHASIASTINVTRKVDRRPYSRITEYSKADMLGQARDNDERIYRITRAANTIQSGLDTFTSFLVSAGTAYFDNTNKPYQRAVWCPSDHISMLGSDIVMGRLITQNTLAISVPKNTYPMIEHIQAEVPYLIATSPIGSNNPPDALQGRLLEATLSSMQEYDSYFELRFLLTGSSFQNADLYNIDFGTILYAHATDLAAQTAVKVALRKFLEMQYAIGRTYKSDQDTDPNTVLYPLLGYTTYWQKLNGVVEVATSTTDGRIASAGQLFDLPDYATNSSSSILAPVLRATNIWLRYDPASAGTITYDLLVDKTVVNEGGTINYTLVTTGLTNGSQVAYNITGIDQADLSSGSLTGYFTIINSVGTLSLNIAMDELTEGPETCRLTIVADPTVFKETLINDTSTSVNATCFYGVTSTATSGVSSMNEGETRYFIAQVQGIEDGTYLYPKILQSSQADVYDLSQPLPSSVRVTSGRAVFAITAIQDSKTEGDEILSIGLYRDAQFTNSLVSASIKIVDTSRTPEVSIRFSANSNGSGDISNTTVNEGTYVYLYIITDGYPAGTQFKLRYGNSSNPSAVEVNDSDFSTTRPSTVTTDANGRAIVAYFIANDYINDQADADTLETFHVELLRADDIYLTRTMINVRDTSRQLSGSFNLLDITDAANPVLIFNSSKDGLAGIRYDSPSSTGIKDPVIIGAYIAPLDIALIDGHKYRIVYVHSQNSSTTVTRAMCPLGNNSNVSDYGVGLGSYDTLSATSGKPLTMINDGSGNTLGYGCIFEFQVNGMLNYITAIPPYHSMYAQINILVLYPNYYSEPVAGKTWQWGFSQHRRSLVYRETNLVPKIKNLYRSDLASGTSSDTNLDGAFSLMSKEVTVPFGGYVDILIVGAGGSGGTSSQATSGSGVDGNAGRSLGVFIPKHLGASYLEINQAPASGDLDNYAPIPIDETMLWDKLLTISGGGAGRSQSFNEAQTNLGGVGGSVTIESNKDAILAGLNAGKLFAKAGNTAIQYEIICEVISVVQNKSWQSGKSTNDNHEGGKGILPPGSSNQLANYVGSGGKGGDSIGTGTGYGGGGGSGAIVYLRLGTRVLSESYTVDKTIGPLSFLLADLDAINAYVSLPTTASATRTPFAKALGNALTGGNTGASGSELTVVQVDYQADAKKALLVNAATATPRVKVRPTRNSATAPTLPVKSPLSWNIEQLNQVVIPKFASTRLILLPTGVEGSYTNEASEVVNGLAAKATNVLNYNTVTPNATPNETVGDTFVYVAGAAANTDSSAATIKSGKLSVLNRNILQQSKTLDGSSASAASVNSISRGGYIDLMLSNFGTSNSAFFVELPRVQISDDNPLKVADLTAYPTGAWYSTAKDSDGNSLSSKGYNLALGDGALYIRPYDLSTVLRVRPWIENKADSVSDTDRDTPIIIQQGQTVHITVVGGGGAQSKRSPDAGVATPDALASGSALRLSIRDVASESYSEFLVCDAGTGSIDNTTNPTASSTLPSLNLNAIQSYLTVFETPELYSGNDNPIKGAYGGVGSGSYAKLKLYNHYPQAIVIKATGGRGGSGESSIQTSDGVVLIEVH